MTEFIAKLESFFEEMFSNLFKKSHASFIVWFAVIFLGTVAILAGFGLLPSELLEETPGNFVEEAQQNNPVQPAVREPDPEIPGEAYGILPSQLVIPAINVDTVIYNPVSTSTKTLDAGLLKGPVRYPGSGTIGAGNMFIFGHSTGWQVVINKAYKVFNNLKNLKPDDPIYLTSEGKTYEYRVRLVTEVDKNDTLITFDTSVNMLTLSTCDSFGARSDRFVVTADYIGVR